VVPPRFDVEDVDVSEALVQKYAEKQIDRVTISRMLHAGEDPTPERLIVIAQHVQKELATRLARRLLDIQTLPYIVVINPNFQQVYKLYRKAFKTLINSPKVVNISQDAEFVEVVKGLVHEAVQVVPWLAKGCHDASKKVPASQLNLNRFMADMIMSRISRRVIAEQYISLHEERPGYIGVICKEMSPYDVVQRVAPEAQATCQRSYGIFPGYEIEGDKSITCSYLPTHLEYIMFELLKNSMRAVVEQHSSKNELGKKLPPIKILLARGPSDISIRISDQGGGVPRKHLDRIFDFGFSTFEHESLSAGDGHEPPSPLSGIDANVVRTSPMAGLGFGLPTCRLYAQYFGGDVWLNSMEGYGSDVLVRLDHMGETKEFSNYDGFDIWKSLRCPDVTLLDALQANPRVQTHAYKDRERNLRDMRDHRRVV